MENKYNKIISQHYVHKNNKSNFGTFQKLVMKEGSTTFDDWKHAPLPIYMNYYVFNYTNVQDILKKGSKPILQEIGPYAYR